MSRGRLFHYLISIAFVLSLNFFVVQLLPGDPLVHLLGEEAYMHLQARDPQALTELRARYGLDRPMWERYLRSMADILRCRLGWSFQYGEPVSRVLLYRLKWTLILLAPALFISAVLGVLSGCLTGRPGRSSADRFVTPCCLLLYATPAYCLAFLLLWVFAFWGDLLPLGGMRDTMPADHLSWKDLARHLILPLSVLVLHNTAYLAIIMRSTIRQAFSESYVLTAMSKGLSQWAVLARHVLPNAVPPFITALAINLGFMVGGALLVEVVFSWQGMGTLIFGAVLSRDYPILSGAFLVLALSVIGANIVADILTACIDPRLRDEAAAP